ncbi:MAG: mannose-1-phosphate guanylyltransferase [Candidatus Omnitrophota bacterium]
MKKDVFAVLLAGGKGTRLWPLSTKSVSKSFVRIGRLKPLIVVTMRRLSGAISKSNTMLVVDKVQDRLLRTFVKGVPKSNILVEPFGRSTASAIGLAAINMKPDDIMVVMPTDQLIKRGPGFLGVIKRASDHVRKNGDVLMCIGIKPTEASSAYGYIKVGDRLTGSVYSIERFLEKPTRSRAARLIKSGDHLWNAGMFVFKAGGILNAIKKHAPNLYRQLQYIRTGEKSIDAAYRRLKNISIDYQIMEKAENLCCVKGNFCWHDLGSWVSLEGLQSEYGAEGLGARRDDKGNLCFGSSKLVDTKDSIIYNGSGETLGVVGMRGVVVVRAERGILVCDKKDAEKVKELVAKL